NDASAWVDLSAAHLAACVKDAEYEQCLDSIVAADHALAMTSRNAVARFNRAVAIEQLGLVAEAREEWRRCQADATSHELAEDARNNVVRLAPPRREWCDVV